MSMLARYKKQGGIMELVKLIESSSEPKRTQLLNMVRGEDAAYANAVEARLLTWPQLKEQQENVLAEIISATPPKFVATAVYGESDSFLVLVEKCLGRHFQDYKLEKESLKSAPPNESQIESARRKVMGEVRKLEAAGSIRLHQPGVAPVPEAPATPSVAVPAAEITAPSTSPATTALAAAPKPDAATAATGCPSIASFKLEPALAGLNGERFDIFIRKLLGT